MQVEVIRADRSGNNLKILRDLAKQEVVLKVGILEGSYTSDGVNIAEYAAKNEYGDDNVPSRPFMRNTQAQHEKQWRRYIQKSMEWGIYDFPEMLSGMKLIPQKVSLAKIFSGLGERVSSDIQRIILWGNFKPNSPYTVAQKIKHGSPTPTHPLMDTGQMIDSIGYEVQEYERVKKGTV